MVKTAVAVAGAWPGSAVWSAPSVKPIDTEAVADICRKYETVVVLEEHSVIGGLGSTVAEIAAAYAPAWVCRVGIPDRFSRYCGSYGYLMEEHRLTADAVAAQVRDFLARVSGGESRPQPTAA
jgi:transketolase